MQDRLAPRPTVTVVRRPAKQWTYVCRVDAEAALLECTVCKHVQRVDRGEVFITHCKPFASADLAETFAREVVIQPGVASFVGVLPLD